jgi:hypothetical protein
MNMTTRILALSIVGACTLGPGASLPAAELCPMGGVMIKAQIDKGKALAWAASPRAAAVSGAETDNWYLYVRSGAEQAIGIMIAPGFVFFGVAGRGGEVYRRDIEQAFGKDLGKLRLAVRKDLDDLVRAGVVRINAAEVQPIAGIAGLGTLEKAGDVWGLSIQRCQAVNLPISGL